MSRQKSRETPVRVITLKELETDATDEIGKWITYLEIM